MSSCPFEAELMPVSKFQNRLLRGLSTSDQRLLSSELEPIELPIGLAVEKANTRVKHAYFPEAGIISVVARATTDEADQIEAGLIGREGMSGGAIVLGDHQSPNEAYVQMPGHAYRIVGASLREALGSSASLRARLQLFSQVFMVQITQTALANGKANIEKRLARWLLMSHDRGDDDELQLTHEFIAIMLGVRRSGVTDALHELESKKLVRAGRGLIRISNRAGLEQFAGPIYGVPEAEYVRMLGPWRV